VIRYNVIRRNDRVIVAGNTKSGEDTLQPGKTRDFVKAFENRQFPIEDLIPFGAG
jgi:hypothetical protein